MPTVPSDVTPVPPPLPSQTFPPDVAAVAERKLFPVTVVPVAEVVVSTAPAEETIATVRDTDDEVTEAVPSGSS